MTIDLYSSRISYFSHEIFGFPDFQCVCGGVIFISNKSKYLKTEVRYATAAKTN